MRDVKSVLQYKNIGVMGLARSGIAAAKKLKNLGLNVFLSDSSPAEKFTNLNELLAMGECEFGGHTEKLLTNNLLIVSPGIDQEAPLLLKAKSMGITLWSEIELGYHLTHKDTKIIAVTGSNGKSTTSSLIAHILKAKGYDTILGGNIGDAYCSFDIENKHDFIVLEISSFQLDLIVSFRPNVATILNITPDHLDRYPTFEDYARSKFRIIKNLTEKDIFVYNADCENTNKILNGEIISTDVKHTSCKNFRKFSLSDKGNYDFDNLPLKGPHNHANILAALLCVKDYIDLNNISDTLTTFLPLEHRLEPVMVHNGVEYINDSKATNTDSVRFAMQSFTKPIHLILGGSDKGEDFSVLNQSLIGKVKKLYLIGETADKLESTFKGKYNYEKFTDFESTIKATMKNAVSGEIVLLAPACASFDWFKNFEHRGKEFKRLVKELANKGDKS